MRGKRILYLVVILLSIFLSINHDIIGKNVFSENSLNASLEWSFETTNGISSSPCIIDLNHDNNKEIIFGSNDGKLYCLDINGIEKWSFTTGADIKSSPTAADLNNDGYLEVVVGSYDKNIYCLNYLGEVVWQFQTGNWVFSSPAIVDINADNKLEVIIGSDDDSFYCLNSDGSKLWSFTTLGDISSSPAIVDLDNNGIFEIVFGSNEGNLYCLELSGTPNSGKGQWYSFRGSRFHTGWMDSDSDYVDDLTECCYYQTDPFTPNMHHTPPMNNDPSFYLRIESL